MGIPLYGDWACLHQRRARTRPELLLLGIYYPILLFTFASQMREAPSLVLLFALSFLNDAFPQAMLMFSHNSRVERLTHFYLFALSRAGRIDQMIMLMSVETI